VLGKKMVNVWVVAWSMNMSSILHTTFNFPDVLTTHSRLGRVGCRADTHGVGRRIFGTEEVGEHGGEEFRGLGGGSMMGEEEG